MDENVTLTNFSTEKIPEPVFMHSRLAKESENQDTVVLWVEVIRGHLTFKRNMVTLTYCQMGQILPDPPHSARTVPPKQGS